MSERRSCEKDDLYRDHLGGHASAGEAPRLRHPYVRQGNYECLFAHSIFYFPPDYSALLGFFINGNVSSNVIYESHFCVSCIGSMLEWRCRIGQGTLDEQTSMNARYHKKIQ